MAGLFVTFEGGEGSGKSTQIKLLGATLEAMGRQVVQSREPGGTPEAEALRVLLVNGDTGRWTAEAEALLNYAARDSHLRDIIRPALSAGKIVLCDRFMDSTRAYQGHAGGCDMSLLDALEGAIVGKTRPDLTIMFDLAPEAGLSRARDRSAGPEDRYERKGLKFHQVLRQGYLEIARGEPGRCRIVDAEGSIESIHAKVMGILGPLLHG